MKYSENQTNDSTERKKLQSPHYQHFVEILLQCCEKWFATLQVSFVFNISRQRQPEKIQNAVFKWLFQLLREKGYPNQPGPMWKSNFPLNLITGCASHGGNNCNQAFAITCNESFTSLWSNIGHSSLQNCFNSATLEGFRAWTACLRSYHSTSIGFKAGCWPGHSKTFI